MSNKNNNKKKPALISVDQDVAVNRRARFEYFLKDKVEAGLQLTGTEVKSLRHGQCSIAEAYIIENKEELFLIGAHIAEYNPAGAHLQHNPTRKRKLLLHRREIHKYMGALKKSGMTIVPTRLYFNKKGMAKLEIALAEGKKLHDKRETTKRRDWDKQKSRILKQKDY